MAKTAEQAILESFGGLRNVGAYAMYTDDEYIGHITGVLCASTTTQEFLFSTVLSEVRRLFKEGRL